MSHYFHHSIRTFLENLTYIKVLNLFNMELREKFHYKTMFVIIILVIFSIYISVYSLAAYNIATEYIYEDEIRKIFGELHLVGRISLA